MEQKILLNLNKTAKVFTSELGKCYKDAELTEEVQNFKARRMFSEPLNKKRKLNSLEELLAEKKESSDQLQVYDNKYLNAKVRSLEPKWHAPWELMRVISGHNGWVRSVSVDPSNAWFATGSTDRTIKIWDLASGTLKLTLVGHIHSVRSVKVSDRHSYLFSCGEDKSVMCWDLEQNKIIRHFHGHLSGVYTLSLHPSLDVLVTGSRDCVARVWDIRTNSQVRVLEGHMDTVFSCVTQNAEPQVATGSADATVKLWDLGTGKCINTLTRHKKAIRDLKFHQYEYTFVSAGADNIKLWKCPEGEFLRNFTGHEGIVHEVSINEDNVMASAGDNGSLCFWDYESGYKFQEEYPKLQPGTLSCESAVYSASFDKSGLRLITGHCDKTIKVWKESEEATPESHPYPPEAKVFVRSNY